ncbi:hypothetical protein B9Z51_08585 [Limnohabitans sp. T6-5]|nr:hypothetical protein B9Z51_08585 [Limnohabitans sp. T6-5]
MANSIGAAGTFIQAPAANTLSGILGAKAAADRGLTWLINQAEPGSAAPHTETQDDAQRASQFAAESRAENANTPWNLPARAGRYLEQDSRRVVQENQANDRATNPELMRQQQAMGEAEGFTGNIKAAFQNPLALTHTLVRSAPDMAMGVGVGSVVARARMAGAAAAGEAAAANAAKAGANEATQAAAAKAAIEAVESKAVASASTAGTLSEAGSSAMQAREGTYQEVAGMPLETLAKSPRFQQIMAANGGDAVKAREALANELADQATMLSGAGTMAGSALTNKLFGGDATAKSIVGGRMSAKELGKRIGQDTVEEGLQGVPEDAAQHGATVQADPSKKYDPAGSLAQNMVAGFAMGAGGHGLAYTKERLASMGKGPDAGPESSTNTPGQPPAPGQPTAPPTAPAAPVTPTQPVETEAEKALRTPTSMTALDRAHEITPELTAARERLADLTPENGYGPPFDQERQELADRAQALQSELDGITKTWPKTEYGAKTSFSTEAGARIEGAYALMDADELVTSHDENLRANPLYPQEMQPRDRSRSASGMQVSGIVQKLDPARLGLSADAATGAPIVGEDGLVESGNARTIAMKRMYLVHDGRWPHSQQDVPEHDNGKSSPVRRYRKFLEDNASQFGLTPEAVDAMAKPVLVRVRTTPVNRAEFARQANASTVAAMSPSEQAKSDAARIDAMDDLTPDDAGDFTGPASRPFIRRFMARLPGTEQAGMIDADGNLSTTGYTRVRNAILAKAYGDSPVLMRMVESLDDNLRNITKALISAAPKVAQMRDAIAKGARFDSDITPGLMAAVEEMSRLKDAGTSISDALAQAGMFGDKYSPETRDLLQFLADNIRRPRRMADFILAYMDALDSAGDPAQGSMFGDTQAPERKDLIKAAKTTVEGTPDATAKDTQRGNAGEDTKPGEKAGGEPANAAGGGRSDQGNGPTGPTANEEKVSGDEFVKAPGGKKLWGRLPVPAADVGASALSANLGNEADSKTAMVSSQSPTKSVQPHSDDGKRESADTLVAGGNPTSPSGQIGHEQKNEGWKPLWERTGTSAPVAESNPPSPRGKSGVNSLPQASNIEQAADSGKPAKIEDSGEELEGARKTENDIGAAMLSRSQATQQAYEARIDALFAGGGANRVGVKVLDSSDVLSLLGFEALPLVLRESKVIKGLSKHPAMTADLWKKVPGWIEKPAAVFDSHTVEGALVFVAPELVNGAVVLVTVEPDSTVSASLVAHEVTNAYDKDAGPPPFGLWLRDGLARYVNQKEFPTVAARAGLQLPREATANKPGTRKILTEKNLAGYQKEQGAAMSRAEFSGQGMSKEALDTLVERIKAKMPNMPTVHVLADPGKAPPALREYIIRQDAWDDVEGAMHKGELYMFASGLSDELRAEHVLAEHEAAHYGLRAVLGSSLKTAMHLVYAQNASVRRAVTELQKRGKLSTAEATEEVIVDIPTAELAKIKGWRKVVVMVRDWMQAHGYDKIAQKITDMLDGSLSQQQRADLFVAELVHGARDYVAGKLPSRRVGYIGDTRLSTTLQEDIKRQEAWLQREARARGFADIEDMLAKDYPVFERLAELWRKKNPASEGVMLSRRSDTKANYEARIDALFGGSVPQSPSRGQVAAVVLDRSDILDLLDEGNGPVILDEAAVGKPMRGAPRGGDARHPNMTSAEWKMVPQWLDNPAAVFDSATVNGALVIIAPDLVGGAVVMITLDPRAQGQRRASEIRLLTNAYDKDGSPPPFSQWFAQGNARYIDKKVFPAVLRRVGLQLPDTAYQNKPGTKKILTEKNLAGFIKARQQGEANVTGQKVPSTKNATEAIQTVLLNVQNDGGDARIVSANDPDSQSEPTRLSRAPAKTEGLSAQDRADEIIHEKAKAGGSVLDAAAHALTRMTRLEKLTSWAYDFAAQQLDRFTSDAVKAGVVSDYGVPESVIDQRAIMQGRKMQHLRKVGRLLDKLNTLTRSESRVAYAWMNEADASAADRLMQDLPAESVKVLQEVQKMIDHLSREAVTLGQLSEKAYKAHRFAYLRRSYAKHVVELSDKENAKRSRTISVLGDQYKGRGFEEGASMRQIQAAAPGWWKRKTQEGQADTALKGEKFIRLERRAASGEGVTPLEGMDGKQPGKVLEVNYWPAAEPMPAKYQDWTQAGTFEARDTQGDKVVMWRDYTADERTKMGEVDEARFAIAKTLHGMIHDVEVGRYLAWLAKTQAKLVAADVPGKLVTAEEGWGHVFKPGEWVQVPDTKIAGTAVAKYGKLAGRFIPGPVWNDVRQVSNPSFGKVPIEAFNTLQGWWKTSKTALSPGVHMNNIMSNFVMADWHDVSQAHVRKALRILMAASNRDNKGILGKAMNQAAKMGIADREAAQLIVNRYKDSGGELGSWATVEMQNDQLEPILKDLQKELGIEDELGSQVGAFNAVQQFMHAKFPAVYNAAGGLMGSTPGRIGSKAAGKVVGAVVQEGKTLIDLYQSEDEVFRLAAWLKAKESGVDDMAAGKVSRKSFLDYSVNAPWIVAMKNSAWPFMAFSYRAIPMFLETAGKKPHKLLKLMAVAGALNAMGAMLAGGDDDEDELRKLLPEEKAGKIWGGVPKLIRMPWNDAHGSPVFLDVRRFVPVGDVFDVGQGHSAIPLPPALQIGGIIGMLSELMLNKSAFTGKAIALETDTMAEQSGKVLDYMYKWMMPNVLILPGSYAYTGVQNAYRGKEDGFGRAQSMAQAISSAFGLKLGSYPTDGLRRNLVKKTEAESSEIDHNIAKLRRQYQVNGISREEFDEGVEYQRAKKTKLWEELGEKMR